MSLSAAHESKAARRRCQSCQDRKARFAYRGVVRADRDHTLCFACYRAERERRRASQLGEPRPAVQRLPGPRVLTDREIAHRRRMLACAAAARQDQFAGAGAMRSITASASSVST